jgi:hypothetical protein
MLLLMKKSVRIARDVASEGVHCPVRLELIDPSTCEPCQFLSRTDYDSSGAITALVCTPSIRAMLKES